MHQRQTGRTESKGSLRRFREELEPYNPDLVSNMSYNDSKVADLAIRCIKFIRENPGVTRDDIIKEIDY